MSFSRFALTLGATMTILGGCDGAQLTMDSSVVPAAHRPALPRESRGRSWISPDAKTIKKLLYVSDGSGTVYVFNYKTKDLVGKLTGENGFSQGQCVDKAGNVWFIDFGNIDGILGSAIEYAHGGSAPLKTLKTQGYSIGCSIDPTSGDLAVANTSNAASGPPNVVVFKNASGAPKTYYNYYCGIPLPPGYDRQGNLYVEGAVGDSTPNAVCEIPHGGRALKPVAFNASIPIPEGVMWDGRYITLATEIGTPLKTAIYQMAEDESGNLRKVGKTVLTDTCKRDRAAVVQPFIVGYENTPANRRQGNVVVGGNTACERTFDYWNYPAGGDPVGSLLLYPSFTESQSVSIAPN